MESAPDTFLPEPSNGFVTTPFVDQIARRALTYLQAGYPIHFAGAAGTGKTTVAFHVAAQLGRPVSLIHGDDDFGSSDLVGQDSGYRKHKVIDNYIHSVVKTEEEMKSLWLENRLTTACQDGDTLIYDEFNRSRPEANNPFLSIFSERILNLPKLRRSGGGYLQVHPEFRAIFTSNPEEYAGVHKTQDALMDRLITIQLEHYDRETEIQITACLLRHRPGRCRNHRGSGAQAPARRREQQPADHPRLHRHRPHPDFARGACPTGGFHLPMGLPRYSEFGNGQGHSGRPLHHAPEGRGSLARRAARHDGFHPAHFPRPAPAQCHQERKRRMPPLKQIIRGVKDIRTRSGTPDQVIVPYKAYMAITALEMEKFRRETERKNLTLRLINVNARLQTVELEKEALLLRLGKETAGRPVRRPIKSSRSIRDCPATGSAGGFKFQY